MLDEPLCNILHVIIHIYFHDFLLNFSHEERCTVVHLYSVRGLERSGLGGSHGAFGTDFYDRSITSPKHRAYYRYGRPVIKIGLKGALGSHEIRPIHSAPSLGQSIPLISMESAFCFFHRHLGLSRRPPFFFHIKLCIT